MFTPIQMFADWLIYHLFDIPENGTLGSALNFFVYDTIKIFILLLFIIYAITFIRSFFSPEKTKKILAKNKGSNFLGHILGRFFNNKRIAFSYSSLAEINNITQKIPANKNCYVKIKEGE